jgi:diguanylate cyclase (GGDEF)-like protein
MLTEPACAPLSVLLIEDNPADARLMQEVFAGIANSPFELEHMDRLASGLARLTAGGIDVVLLDLSLPDSQGLDTLVRVQAHAPDVPIVVLTGLDDEALAVQALQQGAQDYLVKGTVDSNILTRSVRYAIERHRMQQELRALSLIDEMTGLHNRRGFLTLAQQQVKLSNRTNQPMLLLVADLNNLKLINDTLGHHQGDQALIETAKVLKETVREQDIVARFGGDEFAVLLIGAKKASASTAAVRLQEKLAARNTTLERPYKLSVSVGVACYDPSEPCAVEELIARADALMYKQKYEQKRTQ